MANMFGSGAFSYSDQSANKVNLYKDPVTGVLFAGEDQNDPAAEAVGGREFTSPNSIVLFGDSITNNNNVNNGQSGASNVTTQSKTQDIGWFTWANIMLNGAFKVVRNSAVAGDKTGDMLARMESDVLAYAPSWVLVAGGINDRDLGGGADRGFDYTVGNLKAICSRLNASGSMVLLATLIPNNAINTLGAGNIKVENLMRVNDWIRRYAEATPGVVCVDVFSSIYDQTTVCGAISGSLADQSHPSTSGAWRIGAAAARILTGIIKPRPVVSSLGSVASATNPHGNLIRFSTMSGTTGTLPVTYVTTGTVPEGWWLQESGATANAGHTITMTRPARTDFPVQSWWQTVIAWTAAQSAVCTFTHRLLTGSTLTIPAGVVAGDPLDCSIELEYSGVTNAGPLTVEFIARQGTTELAIANFLYGETLTTPTPAFAGVVTINNFPLPAGADNIFVRVQTRNLAGTAGGYTLRIGRLFCGKQLTSF